MPGSSSTSVLLLVWTSHEQADISQPLKEAVDAAQRAAAVYVDPQTCQKMRVI